jgi:hypothetical protein
VSRLFSAGHMCSPVSSGELGECNAIMRRGFGHRVLTFVSSVKPCLVLPMSRASTNAALQPFAATKVFNPGEP